MAFVIEQCEVSPPPGCAAELILPLTSLDILWLTFHRIRWILFFKHPISKTSFIQTIIPNLKESLSLTLKHYIPLAGNFVCPLKDSSGYPELRYVTGDSVSVTFSETDMDFSYLTSNHPRNSEDFYPLVPKLAEAKIAPGVQLAPLLAIQVTLFPNLGISIGFTHHHVAADGASIVGFARAWASLNKLCGDEQFLANHELIPSYDRSVMKVTLEQGMLMWNVVKNFELEICDNVTLPHDKVRGTFIIRREDILKLKNLILSRRPSLTHVTSFTVTCAYIWTCLAKSEAAIGKEMRENGMEFFLFSADYRARFNPPLAQTYFGNCLVGYMASTWHADLVGEEGFTIAVELIGAEIQKRSNNEEWILSGDWLKELLALRTIDMNRPLSVAGSPKLDFYGVDFSWGRPEKLEILSIDNGAGLAMSISKSKDSNGDLEVGLSLPRTRMNAFDVVFAHGLSIL